MKRYEIKRKKKEEENEVYVRNLGRKDSLSNSVVSKGQDARGGEKTQDRKVNAERMKGEEEVNEREAVAAAYTKH